MKIASYFRAAKTKSGTGRDVYVEDGALNAVWGEADISTQDAMDLTYLSGQRPADTLKFDERYIRDGMLHVAQGKTKKKLRIAVVGELASVIERTHTSKSLSAAYT